MKRKVGMLVCGLLGAMPLMAQRQLTVEVTNPSESEQKDAPVVVELGNEGDVDSALVLCGGREQPYQLDDLNRDCRYDELCFLVDLKGKEKKIFQVKLFDHGTPEVFKARTYAQLVVPSKNRNLAKNQQDIYLRTLAFDKKTKDRYHYVHSHGLCFESELMALRVYFDRRQTVDVYGKRHKGLEMFDTQFYPSESQLKAGYGDDVLWVGDTYGLGALRGWDGQKSLLLDALDYQEQRVVSEGPLRAIVEVADKGWIPAPGMKKVNALIRYTLYAGHRDVQVDVFFDRKVTGTCWATGLIHIKHSSDFGDRGGLRGVYGYDWAAGKSDGIHQPDTVGLGIFVPQAFLSREVPAQEDVLTDVLKVDGNHLRYHIACTSKRENFGFKDAGEWFAWLKTWKQHLLHPVKVTVR